MRLPIRIGELAVRIRSGVNIIADRRMTDYGELDPARGEADLESAFSPNDRHEFMRLFKLQPGASSTFPPRRSAQSASGSVPGRPDARQCRMLRRPIASCSPGACASTASAD